MLGEFESKPPREQGSGDSTRRIEELTAALEQDLQAKVRELEKRRLEDDLKRWRDHLTSLETGLQEGLQKIVGDGIDDQQQLARLKQRSEAYYKSRIEEAEQKIADITSELERL